MRILAAITFHYRQARLEHLFSVVRALCAFPVEVMDVVIVTNVDDKSVLSKIGDVCGPLFASFPVRPGSKKSLSIESFTKLADPWALTWCHKYLIPERFISAPSSYSHFIYLEDDILFSFDNFCYFTRYRETLRNFGLIPSFQRVEYNDFDGAFYLSDQIGVSNFAPSRRVDIDGYSFVNLDYPYNAMFILDRELALEYVASPSFNQEQSKMVTDWLIAERAAMGLCFENPPEGFRLRHVAPIDPETLVAPYWSWIFHLPNTYVKNQFKPFAKTRVEHQFAPQSTVVWRPPSKVREYTERIRRRILKAAGI